MYGFAESFTPCASNTIQESRTFQTLAGSCRSRKNPAVPASLLFSYFKGRRDGCSERYKDYPFDELLPLISQQKYNVATKKMFLAAGLIRPVVVYNSTTSEQEIRPLDEVAEANAKEIEEDMKRDLVSMLV